MVVESDARQRRDNGRRTELVARIEADLLALERRVRDGRLKNPDKIGQAAQRILADSGVTRLFDVEIAKSHFSYRYNENAFKYEELLAGRYVLTTSLTSTQASTSRVVAAYQKLAKADICDPDLDHQHLTANRALLELNRIRCVQLTANQNQISLTTRPTLTQTRILKATKTNTHNPNKPTIT